MFTSIIILIVIVAVVLILVVLAQNSKGGGLTSQFGGSGTSQLMGVKKTGDILEKMTWGLALALILLTMSTKFLLSDINQGSDFTSPNIQSAQDKNIAPAIDVDQSPSETLEIDSDSAE